MVAKPRKHERWHKKNAPVPGPPGPVGPMGAPGPKGDMAPPPPDMSATVEKFVTEMRKKFGSPE